MAYPLPQSLLGGRYVLEGLIGVGGMGAVYNATQTALSRRVAIKVLRPEHSTNPGIVEHFRREAFAASRVVHPNLVTILDVGDLADGTPFLVMEYVPGRPLGELLRAQMLPIDQIVRITRQVLAALAEVHRCGVVHADIKSDNVLVDRAAEGSEKVKLIDFGLAHVNRIEPAVVAGGIAHVAGTPEFMAPEVIRGKAPTSAADLYSLGIVLYELLTGVTPFAGGTAAEIMSRHLVEPVVAPSLRQPQRAISGALDDVVLRALAKVPDERFEDADELSAALLAASGTVAAAPRQLAHEERQLRAAIARAIRAGDADRLTDAYRALADHLVRTGHPIAAVDELRDGLDLLTAADANPAAVQAAQRLRAAMLQIQGAAAHDDLPTLTT